MHQTRNGFALLEILIAVAIIAVVAAGGFYLTGSRGGGKGSFGIATGNTPVERAQQTAAAISAMAGVKNATYQIEGKSVTLVDGRAGTPAAPGSASRVVTQYFGNAAVGDLNGDGIPDVAFVLTQTSGGTGIFYYVAVALGTGSGFRGTNAVFLGDRIAPQTTGIRAANDAGANPGAAAELIVNYADRKPNEPMSAAPSVGVSKYLKISADGKLAELQPTANP